MAVKAGESESDRAMRGGSYATLMRLNAHDEYFERASRLQPKAIAVFGGGVQTPFERLNQAQKLVREAAVHLTWRIPVHPEKPSQEDFEMRMRLRGDLWTGFGKYEDRVEKELVMFRSEVEAIFRPVIEREFRGQS